MFFVLTKFNMANKKSLIAVKVLSKIIKFYFLKIFYGFEYLLEKKPNFKKKIFNKESIFLYSNYISKKLNINSCFTRSLVIRELLQENGFIAKIEIGIKKVNGNMVSHCWVSSGGIYNETKEVRQSFRILNTK